MKKGCLTGIGIFLAICVLFGMCSSDSTDDSTTFPTIDTSTVVSTGEYDTSTLDTTQDSAINTSAESDNEHTTPITEPPHIHSFSTATCTAPKTCACGVTEGNATGHTWKDATCSDPKTCTVCGTTSGLTAGHNFSNGSCITCGKADPDYKRETMVWIPTKGGTKYHTHAGCSNMDDPNYVTQAKAESLGFTPCKRCH